MRTKYIVLSAIAVMALSRVFPAFGGTVTLRSVSSGTYEDGIFTPGYREFEAVYDVNEAAGTVCLEKTVTSGREGKREDTAFYEITSVTVGKGISDVLVSRNKRDQRIITAVREAGLGASETLMIGDDFYEFCRAENGKFYLEYGEVTDGP